MPGLVTTRGRLEPHLGSLLSLTHIWVIPALKRHLLSCHGQWGTLSPLLLASKWSAAHLLSSRMAWAFVRRKGLKWTWVEVAQAARGFHGSCLPHAMLFWDPGGPMNIYYVSKSRPLGNCQERLPGRDRERARSHEEPHSLGLCPV